MKPRRVQSTILLLLAACGAPAELEGRPPRRLPQRGMVVCEHPLAARVGVDVLERGGNAVDAAVATALALAVVYPQAGNLGGGGFALWVPAEGEPQALDFRETAPASAEPELYRNARGEPAPELLSAGALAVAVPGTPAGLWALQSSAGSGLIPFAELVAPAIALAREGFDVDALLAADLARPATRARLMRYPGARALLYPGDAALSQGARLVQPELAATLSDYALGGPLAFYQGDAARALVRELARVREVDGLESARGQVSLADLSAYEVRWRDPLRGWFRGNEVITMPPPSSGGIIVLQVLSVLDGFPLDAERGAALAALADGALPPSMGEEGGVGERSVHWWIEALRHAFAERAARLGDPDFAPVPVEDLLSPGWVACCRMAIGEQAEPALAGPAPLEGESTTHVSVLDAKGNSLSLTTTLNSDFGSGILVRGAGFFLNNEMDDFSLGHGVPNQFGLLGGEANAIQPRKRPLSSMTPTVVRQGGHTTALVLGSPGGPRIITSLIGVLQRTLVYEQPLSQAVAAPRFHQQWSPAWTEFEPGWSSEFLEALRRRGQDAREVDKRWGSVQAIRVQPDGRVEGASDPRRGGTALGTP